MSFPSRQTIGYIAVLAVCFLVAMAGGWTTLGTQIDNDAYDFLFRVSPFEPASLSSIVLAIDERTLIDMGGIRHQRDIISTGLEAIAEVEPRAVVVDLILADQSDPEQDARLAAAFAATPNLVLSSDLITDGWEDPRLEFSASAAAIGHVHADPDPLDNVTRRIPLEKAAPMDRRWALSLEAYRLANGAGPITESSDQLDVDGLIIPAARRDARSIFVRYLRRGPDDRSPIPMVTVAQLTADPSLAERFQDRVVFVGVTAQSAADDRHMTPYSAGQPMPGVEIHATAYETLAHGQFLIPASDSSVLLFCLSLCVAAGLTFAFRSGWWSYVLGGLLLVAAHAVPFALFHSDVVFAYTAPVATAWLSVVGAATYQHFVVRRRLRTSETARSRYQQAIHFVTHEMRSPLTAIQGSSELMGRYKLPEEKSNELAKMINAESKRLARMIQTFLDVERITEGEMEIKREPYEVIPLIDTCFERVKPLAERKRITVKLGHLDGASLIGDFELMEYAVYNLMNNAVKYSPVETEITVSSHAADGHVHISVQDQGIGMDEKELKNIFKKFYRTKKAESSGITGTGIGLSIVDQIVTTHHGRMKVTSQPEQGSTFTIILPL
jgi:signal transduction histidine kinase